MILIQDVETFTPDPAGRTDLLLAGTRIERIAPASRSRAGWPT
jgi:hypothetical protein